MRWLNLISLLLASLILSACQPPAPVCPPGALSYQNDLTAVQAEAPQPAQVSLGRTALDADQLVRGPLCNNHLAGRVYVTCEIQVQRWEDKPLFLDGCDFTVAPGAVVYVAAHNNAAYYNGCAACHMSAAAAP